MQGLSPLSLSLSHLSFLPSFHFSPLPLSPPLYYLLFKKITFVVGYLWSIYLSQIDFLISHCRSQICLPWVPPHCILVDDFNTVYGI